MTYELLIEVNGQIYSYLCVIDFPINIGWELAISDRISLQIGNILLPIYREIVPKVALTQRTNAGRNELIVTLLHAGFTKL
jgi:hypothetical protein